VVNVSAQGSCTVTPTSPINLTVAGGVLVDGTQNVMIKCRCVDDGGTLLRKVRWFFPNTTIVAKQTDPPDDAPYRDNSNRISTLVIPTFNDSYDGMYTCGVSEDNAYPPNPLTTITLTLPGEKYHKLCYLIPNW